MTKTHTESSLDKYKRTYSYQSLLKKHSLDEVGIWEVRGEDPNCDLGGYHHQPKLGTFSGKLEDIVAYAVTLSGFWGWGSGGDIIKVSAPVKIDSNSVATKIAIEQKIKYLEEELAKARNELKGSPSSSWKDGAWNLKYARESSND